MIQCFSTSVFTSIFVKSESENAADRFVLDCLQFIKVLDTDKREDEEVVIHH